MCEDKIKELNFGEGVSIDDAIEMLKQEKEQGNTAFGIFNGVKLSTENLSVDDAYKLIIGQTKEEYENDLKILLEKYAEEKQRNHERVLEASKERIPYWIQKGHEIFPEELWSEWDEIVPIRASDTTYGVELDVVIAVQYIIMENKEDMYEEINELLKQYQNNSLVFLTSCLLIKAFCKNGNDTIQNLEY